MTGPLTAEVIREQAGLDALAEDWGVLYADCPTATPFQSHAWMAAWARAYCAPGQLRVVVVRSAGRLVAVAPLQLVRRGPWKVLEPLGGEITDFTDLLISEPRGEAGRALVDALLAEPGWRALDLPQLRPDAMAGDWAGIWPGRCTQLQGAISLELPGLPLPELLERLPGRTASTLRRKLRKVDGSGIAISTVPVEEVPEAVRDMLALHAEQWAGRGINPEHLTARFAAHMTEAISGMAAGGQAAVVQYRLGGDLLGSQLDLLGHGFLGYYLAGISPRLKEHVDVASMQVRSDIGMTLEKGLPRYSMMRGQEDYKLRWRPETVQHTRLLLSRPGRIGGLGLPVATAGRAGVIRWAKAHAPWLRAAHERLSRLRSSTS